MKLEDIPVCSCKEVANMSEEALRNGQQPSLAPSSPCYACTGTRILCDYYSHPDIKPEDKTRIYKELMSRESGRFILGIPELPPVGEVLKLEGFERLEVEE